MSTPMFVIGLLILAASSANASLAVKEGDRRSAIYSAAVAAGVIATLVAFHITA